MKKLLPLALILPLLALIIPSPTPPPTAAQFNPTISRSNADQLQNFAIMGRGWVPDLQWQAEDLIVGATDSVWRFPVPEGIPQTLFRHPSDTQPGEEVRRFAFGETRILTAGPSEINVYDLAQPAEPIARTQIDENFDTGIRALHLLPTEKAAIVHNPGLRQLYENPFVLLSLDDLDNPTPIALPDADWGNVAFHGTRILALGAVQVGEDSINRQPIMMLYDVNDGGEVWRVEGDDAFAERYGGELFGGFTPLAFSGDGQTFALTNGGETVLLDAATGDILSRRDNQNLDATPNDLLIANDGVAVQASFTYSPRDGLQGWLSIYDMFGTDWEQRNIGPGYVGAIDLDTTQTQIAYYSYSGVIGVLPLDNPGAEPVVLADNFWPSADILRWLDGELYVGGFDGVVRVGDEFGPQRVFAPDTSYIYELEVLPSGDTLAVMGQNMLGTYDLDNFNLLRDFSDTWDNAPEASGRLNRPPAQPLDMTVLENGAILAAEIYRGDILVLYSIDALGQLQVDVESDGLTYGQLTYAPYQPDLYVFASDDALESDGHFIRVYDADGLRGVQQFAVNGLVDSGLQQMLYLRDDTLLFIFSDADNCIWYRIDLAAEQATQRTTSPGRCSDVVQSPADQNLLATIDRGGTFSLRDIETGDVLNTLDNATWSYTSLTFNGNGTRLYAGTVAGQIHVWGVE